MEAIELPLFEVNKDVNSIDQSVPSESIIKPLFEVLNSPLNSTTTPNPSVEQSLDDLFPEQKIEDKRILRAKQILGETAVELTPTELKNTIVEIQYLVDTWLDDFEKQVFEGKTLKELLHEKRGL